MSEIGFYRYKINPAASQEVKLYINNVYEASKNIIAEDFCNGSKRLKFLNKEGQYRFQTFTRYYETSDKPKEIGKVNKIITSLLSGQTNRDSIGFKNDRILSLTAEAINQDKLDILNDIWTSPRVLLYIGDGITDLNTDWIQVTVKPKNPIVRIRKGAFVNIQLEVTLPQHYTINML